MGREEVKRETKKAKMEMGRRKTFGLFSFLSELAWVSEARAVFDFSRIEEVKQS